MSHHPKRLLFVITKAELGGAQSHVADLVRGFAPRAEVHLAAGASGPLTAAARAAGAQVHLLPRLVRSINPLADFASVRECAALLRRVRPDLVHAHSSKAGLVARLAGSLTRTPVVFTAHGWGFSPGVPRRRQLLALQVERAMAPLARRIICVSEFDRQLALRHRVGSQRTLRTVHNGLAWAPAPPPRAGTEAPRFIMVARFSEQKDQDALLRAFARLEGEAHLDLVGSGPRLEACRALANELKLGERATFLGDRHDVEALLARAACFVLSTHYEGLPISTLEAMRAGLPVIASDVGGCGEEIEPERTGLLAPRGDVEALARALQRVAASPAQRETWGRAGRQKFEREFTLERMIGGVEAVYNEVWSAR